MNAAEIQPSYADRLGIAASALCMVHCLVTPFLISFSAVFAHFVPGEERTHRLLALAVASLGATALFRGYRVHSRKIVVVWMAMGLATICFAAWFGDRLPAHGYEVAITVIGSSLMIAAHRMNHSFCRSCVRCVHPEN